MAQSTCPKCESHSFEVVNVTPDNSRFTLMFVQCAECGAVVGTMDLRNIGEMISQLPDQLRSR